jgi:hypothetical protein
MSCAEEEDSSFWDIVRSQATEFESDDSFKFSLSFYVEEKMIEQARNEYFYKIDSYFLPFHCQILAFLEQPSPYRAAYRTRAPHADKVRAFLQNEFSGSSIKENYVDRFGNGIDFLLNEKTAILLPMESDYVYMSKGMYNLEGEDDMLMF